MADRSTSNPVAAASAEKIAGHLNQILADNYALMAQTHLAHWNVEGPQFFELHAAFEEQYTDLFAAIDDLAERVRALGHYAAGGIKHYSEATEIPEGPSAKATTAETWIRSLIDGHQIVLDRAFELRELAAKHGDAETEDLIIGRIQVHQKFQWMLKSTLS